MGGTVFLAWTAPAAVVGTSHLVLGKLVYLAAGATADFILTFALRAAGAPGTKPADPPRSPEVQEP